MAGYYQENLWLISQPSWESRHASLNTPLVRTVEFVPGNETIVSLPSWVCIRIWSYFSLISQSYRHVQGYLAHKKLPTPLGPP